jgi:hypothetical protein
MKRFVPLLALFAAGIAASFALAATPGKNPHNPHDSTSTSTTSGPGKSGDHGNKCHPVNLKGSIPAGTITMTVTHASGPRAKAIGDTATLTVGGNVSVQAWACNSGSGSGASSTAPTLFLRQLHVGGKPGGQTTTTTTTTSAP